MPPGLITYDSADFYPEHICVSKIWFIPLGKAEVALKLCSRRHILVVISKIASLSVVQSRVSGDDFRGVEEIE